MLLRLFVKKLEAYVGEVVIGGLLGHDLVETK